MGEIHFVDGDNIKKEESSKSEHCPEISNAKTFWNNQFKKKETNKNQEISIFDILDRDENEFSFSNEISDEVIRIQESISPENWDTLNEKEKIEILQAYADAISDMLGIQDKPVVSLYDGQEGEYGSYSERTNTVYYNRLYIDSVEDLKVTIPHEVRHSYQTERASIGETREDLLYKYNNECYISPEMSLMDYWNQYIECEARAFANYVCGDGINE